ncbi:MAG: right-handed parallel beta-helix repeat-containing protein [Verrucomicrobia bacterium]|nr:right-handed parallel beta-helix repeat-containing protein [Verrucomicrobiota bacterium]
MDTSRKFVFLLSVTVSTFLAQITVRGSTFTVNSVADTGPGTLRQAITDSNANSGRDTIDFTIGSPYSIQPASALPDITDTVLIDALTGYGAPTIAVDGSAAGYVNGLTFNTVTNCEIIGLQVISFDKSGILFIDSSSNVVRQCVIYSNEVGVTICGGSFNLVGGTSGVPVNVISGNMYDGIRAASSAVHTVIQGNFIGTDASGAVAWKNLFGHGVHVQDARFTLIGGTNVSPPSLGAGNIISGNDKSGILLAEGGAHTTVQGNLLGTDIGGMTALGNRYGITVSQSASNLIGGAVAGTRNTISGNAMYGMELNSTQTYANAIVGNFIGLDSNGSNALPNSYHGIYIKEAPRNRVGGTLPGDGNVISGNGWDGIKIAGVGGVYSATGNVIQGNFIGTDQSGLQIITNGGSGISIECAYTVVGGANAGNLISGNSTGILIEDNAHHCTIVGNTIGPDITGTQILGNRFDGVLIDNVSSCSIGGTDASLRNVISGNGQHGVQIANSNACESVVEGNFIGTDIAGSNRLPNAQYGIAVWRGSSNHIGGVLQSAGNVISGNSQGGVYLSQATQTEVYRNRIGTDSSGRYALSNGMHGINMSSAHSNWIGGASSEGNLIAGNGDRGIYLNGSDFNLIQGNMIGTDVTGTNPVPNRTGIVAISSVSNLIGGFSSGAGNTIAFNEALGVEIQVLAQGIAVVGNSFFDNGMWGIGRSKMSVSANDYQDGDFGPNGGQNYPIPLTASNSGANLIVSGILNSEPNNAYWIEFYGSYACDVSGHGEGLIPLGISMDVRTDASGDAAFTNASLLLPDPPPNFITLIATESNTWNTSEFSPWTLVDSDADGMGDGFETRYFGHRTAGDPGGDHDGDLVLNLGEFLGDTDPFSYDSALQVISFNRDSTSAVVNVQSSPYRQYSLQYVTPPTDGNWHDAYLWHAGNGSFWRDGNGNLLSLDYPASETSRCYRVRARLPLAPQ